MKTQRTSPAPRAPRLAILLAGGVAVCLLVTLDPGLDPLGVVSAGTTRTLTTTYASTNGRSGQMFDVHTTETLRVIDLSCNVDAPLNTPVQWEIYTRSGSYEFKTQDPLFWTLRAQGTARSRGRDVPTLLGADLNLVLPENQVTGFYVTLVQGQLASTDTPTQYAIAASNLDLAIVEGIGITYPFGGIQQRQIWNGTVHYGLIAGTPFCFGDTQLYTCPCDNYTTSESGCLNSSGQGARLDSCGSQSIAAGDLEFQVTGLPADRPALLISGRSMINGGSGAYFGDGLACVGGNLRQHGVIVASTQGVAHWSQGAIAQQGYQSGETRYFQAIFRDLGPCGSPFNLSNGFAVTFEP